jgi:hypothetical protein
MAALIMNQHEEIRRECIKDCNFDYDQNLENLQADQGPAQLHHACLVKCNNRINAAKIAIKEGRAVFLNRAAGGARGPRSGYVFGEKKRKSIKRKSIKRKSRKRKSRKRKSRKRKSIKKKSKSK